MRCSSAIGRSLLPSSELCASKFKRHNRQGLTSEYCLHGLVGAKLVQLCWRLGKNILISVYNTPHARNLPLPVISRRPSSATIRRAACGVTSSVLATIPADINGFAITSSTSSGSFEDVRRPSSFRSNIVFANVSRSCSFMPSSAAASKPWAMASSRVSQSRCRRRSTEMVLRPRLTAARWAPEVMPSSRRIDAENSRPSQGAC